MWLTLLSSPPGSSIQLLHCSRLLCSYCGSPLHRRATAELKGGWGLKGLHPLIPAEKSIPTQAAACLQLRQVIDRMLTLIFIYTSVCSSDPSSWWVLLLYVHVAILARATSAPQTTATVLTGSSKDPCSSWSPAVPTKRYPALDVIWPEKEVPLSKEQVSWEPKRILLSEAGCEHRVGGWVDLREYLQPAEKH